jgi:epoxyqueuosine reductase
MRSSPPWREILEELETQGIQARVVPAERLDEVRARAKAAMAEAGFAPEVVARIEGDFTTGLPDPPRGVRSVIIAAVSRPLTQANLTWCGERRTVTVPPHYAGYYAIPRGIAAKVDELLRPSGFGAAFHEPPLKTLATCAGLARYGRNNIAYVPGLGSWLQFGACVSDAPPPDDTAWGEPQLLQRCERCTACLRACPTGAIAGDRFVLHTERCLTWHNEDEAPFPAWLDVSAHHCAVGCLRCQQACPENARVERIQAAPEWFDEEETAAILAAEVVADATRAKLERCGLDYSPTLIARNIRVLLGA